MFTNTTDIGQLYEKKAADYLKSKGYSILDMNYRCRYGEIDIIAKASDHTIVFVEVKSRSNTRFGTSYDALSHSKCQKIRKTSNYYIFDKKLDWNRSYRYDVIVFQSGHVEHIINAFC